MSSPHPIPAPDFEDEFRDIHVDPRSLRQEAEEEPLELETSEEEPEEEPEEEEEEEEEPVEEPFPVFVGDPYLPPSSPSHQQLSDRLDQQEVAIDLLQDNIEVMPGPDELEDVYREVATVRDDYSTLRDLHERLEGRVEGNASRLDELELQVRRFGEEMTDLRSMMEELTDVRSMMEEMRDSISHLARRLPRQRRE